MLIDLDLNEKNFSIEVKKLIINSYRNISYIDYVVNNKFINDEHIQKIIKIVINENCSFEPEMIINLLKFLINFFLKSFFLGILENFKIFADFSILKSIYSAFCSLKRTQLEFKEKQKDECDFIMFLISCFIITISLKSNVWVNVFENKIIKPCCEFIRIFIYNLFNEKFDENNEITFQKLELIKILSKILSFISKETIYKKIHHTEFFKYIFELVIDLFHIDYPEISMEIYNIFNICTYYNDCKILFYGNEIFHILKDDLLSRILITLNEYNSMRLISQKIKETKTETRIAKEEINNEKIESRFDEKIELLDNIINKINLIVEKNFKEFSILTSILCNLLVTNDYQIFSSILLSKNKQTENIISGLSSFVEFYENKDNVKNRIVTFEKEIHPAKVFLLIKDPLIKFINGKIYEFDEGNEKTRYTECINEYKKMISLTIYDEDSHHKVFLKYKKIQLIKILFIIHRFLTKCRNYRDIFLILTSILDSTENIVYKNNTSVIINREWLRIIHTLLLFSDNTLFWLKFDSNKINVDFSNNSDVVINYKTSRDFLGKTKSFYHNLTSDNKKFNEKYKHELVEKDEIIILPYNKVKSFSDKMGIIMSSKHTLLIPKKLELPKSFTIFFRFYFPLINTNEYHVLLQDGKGAGGLIVITNDRRRLGSFSTKGEFINSGINLEDMNLEKHCWVNAAISYSENNNFSKIDYFFEGNLVKTYEKENYKLPRNIVYIGNGSDYNQPFGVFCDLRIYSCALNLEDYRRILKIGDNSLRNNERTESSFMSYIYHKIIDKIIENFLNPFIQGTVVCLTEFENSDESFYFFIKIINCLMVIKENRSKFIQYPLILKIMEFYSSRSVEIKKDISKFLNTFS